MRSVVREKLAAGQSSDEVKAYFVSKYGEWILLEPKPRGMNLMVYVAPFLLLLGGAWLIVPFGPQVDEAPRRKCPGLASASSDPMGESSSRSFERPAL